MMMRNLVVLMVAVLAPNVALSQGEVRLSVPEVRVRAAPPPLRVEVQPRQPDANHVWIAGHWARRGSSNVWVKGVWTRPPQQGMTWERERWNQRNGAWFYSEGHWRWSDESHTSVYEPKERAEVVVVESAPPRDLVERRERPPFRGAVWIPGYWDWDGAQHSWVAGRWSAPQPRAVWRRDRWTRTRDRDPDMGQGRGRLRTHWVLVPGRWNRR